MAGHWKKYFILIVPTLLLGVSILYLTDNLIVPLIIISCFWAIFYLWVYLEKKQGKNESS
ncbi:hypothetical protein ACE1TH_11120 [Shouchella sp. JSM 1781072]|uniref:hypothetical protein n=1 Tax=Bacillaceae TaxID=186817 RepID=UPI000C07B398|nr:hypothetical protein [Bacillus sp. Marseille-P3800]